MEKLKMVKAHKKYILFAWRQGEAKGGLNDIVSSFDNLDEAAEFADTFNGIDGDLKYLNKVVRHWDDDLEWEIQIVNHNTWEIE